MESVNQLLLREATLADTEELMILLEEAYSQYEESMSPDRWSEYRQSIRESVQGTGPVSRLVALSEGVIVGAVQIFLSPGIAYGLPDLPITWPIIRLLAVSPRARGQGIATALITEAAQFAAGLGAPYLHLHTNKMMESAVQLYERLGFERAYDTDMSKGEVQVIGYRLNLGNTHLLQQTG